MRVEERAQDVALEPMEPGLAVHFEDRCERHARLRGDEGVELEEGDAQAPRDLGAYRALARAAQTEQRDDPAENGRRGTGRQQLGRARPQRVGDVLQAGDGDVAGAGLELREESLADVGAFGQRADGEAQLRASRANRGPERAEKNSALVAARRRSGTV